MFGMGFTEILLIAMVAIIALGPEKLPTTMVQIAKFINKIKNSPNLGELYMERLQEIALNPKSGKSQLGLFRIAYETGFTIDYEISGKKLIVKATKKIEDEL